MTDQITFAVGDIHGCFDELQSLLAAYDSVCSGKRTRLVFVGDYVDKGPDSSKVVEFLIKSQAREKNRFICLRGNHEELLIQAAQQDRTDRDLMNWWANGGEQTLDSYGVNDPSDLPAEHLSWISSLPLTFSEHGRLFVHAGIRPGVRIPDQTEKDLMWIREPFLSSNDDHGSFVVHGHTPTETKRPELRRNRVNIDTGACFGGTLTGALFSNAMQSPIQFVNSDGEIWQPRSI